MTANDNPPFRARPFPRLELMKALKNASGAVVSAPVEVVPPPAKEAATVEIAVNGMRRQVQVRVNETLVETLRERLGLMGTKVGCDDGSCGTCTVLLGGLPIYACMALTLHCARQPIETIEGLGTEANPHPLQRAYAEAYAAQCGFCTPGMIMAAKALLDSNPNPTEADVRLGLSGVLCRCGYRNIIDATLQAAKEAQI